MLGTLVSGVAVNSMAATATVKVHISLPQVLTTSLSSEITSESACDANGILGCFQDSKSNGQLIQASEQQTGAPLTYLYIQT
jgi:hypothetical protein